MVVDDCLPTGFNETFVSPKDGKEFVMVPAEGGADFDACDKQVSCIHCIVLVHSLYCARAQLHRYAPVLLLLV